MNKHDSILVIQQNTPPKKPSVDIKKWTGCTYLVETKVPNWPECIA